MRPALSSHNTADRHRRYVQSLGNLSLRIAARGFIANISNEPVSQLTLRGGLASLHAIRRNWVMPAGRIRYYLPALSDHIAYVIKRIAKEEMVRAYARRIIAMVERPQPIRYWTIVQFPREAVRLDDATAIVKMAVSERAANSAYPDPTTVALTDLWPESLNSRARSSLGTMSWHRSLLLRCLAPGERHFMRGPRLLDCT